jgi:monoamine oxidase
MTTLFCTDPADVSLLGALVLARGGGSFEYYADSRITETHLVDGGVPELAARIAAGLGDAVHLSSPVTRITQSETGALVESASGTISADQVIVATPPVLASRIDYEPALPKAHAQLLSSMKAGSIIRFQTVYDEPFWRADGLNGLSVGLGSPVPVALDQSPRSGTPGVLSSYAMGASAVRLAKLAPKDRRTEALRALAERYGAKAADPIAYLETDWSAEHWSMGGMIAHFAPGVLTSYGTALRQPVGRIHWAGTEQATLMHGLIEGAVRSGERAADEALSELER